MDIIVAGIAVVIGLVVAVVRAVRGQRSKARVFYDASASEHQKGRSTRHRGDYALDTDGDHGGDDGGGDGGGGGGD